MKQLIFFFIVIVTLAACSGSKDKMSKDDIKKQIAEHKDAIKDLQSHLAEIDTLKNEELALSVSVKRIDYEYFEHHFDATGAVEAVKNAFVTPETNGQVKTIHVKEGQRVSKGQLLISLNASVLYNSIKEVKTGLELATTMFNKQQELWDKKIGTEVQYLQAKNQKESLEAKLKTLESQLAMSRITAPFSGIIDEIYVKEGELAAPGHQVIQLVNLNELYINADISETYLSKINEGDSVWVKFPSYPDIKVNTKIYRIGNVINQSNRTFKLQLKIKNIKEKLKPNSIAIIRIKDFESASTLLIPTFIIKEDVNGQFVYRIANKNNAEVAEKVYIKTGRSANNKTIVTEGINKGDKIIVNGYNIVKKGMKVKTVTNLSNIN